MGIVEGERIVLLPIKAKMIRWKLNLVMAERRVTGKVLATQLNVHPNTIYRLRRNDEMPSIDGNTLERLCKVLQCEPVDLIERLQENADEVTLT